MRIYIKKIAALTACVLLSSAAIFAQNGGFAGAALRLGFGPRAIGMGNALSATTSEGVYSYYNPALAAIQSEQKQIDLSASSLQFDRVYQTAAVHLQLPPKAGLAISLIRAGVKDIDSRSLSGYPLGNISLSEYQLATAFGIRMSERLYAGVGIKLNYGDYHEEVSPATAFGMDFGFLYKIGPSLNFAFAMQDLIAAYTWNSGDLYGQTQSRNVLNDFPTRFKWALSYQRKAFTISTEYEIQSLSSEISVSEIFIDDSGTTTTISSTETINTNNNVFRLGGTWHTHERFSLRTGYQITELGTPDSNTLSFGFSLHLPFDTFAPSIDYAFATEPYGVANMHVFSLRLNL